MWAGFVCEGEVQVDISSGDRIQKVQPAGSDSHFWRFMTMRVSAPSGGVIMVLLRKSTARLGIVERIRGRPLAPPCHQEDSNFSGGSRVCSIVHCKRSVHGPGGYRTSK